MQKIATVVVCLTMLLLGGCASVPDSIQVQNEATLVNYAQVSANPESSKNAQVRWGGVIASVKNQPDGTLLEVVYYPLRDYGKPIASDESPGRFRVYVNGFLDPMVFEAGRSMTFVGQVKGVEAGQVGEFDYQFPTMQANGYHLWRDVETYDVTGFDYWPYHYWYDFHYRPFGFHHRKRVVVSNEKRGTGSKSQPQQRRNPPAPKPKRSELERVMQK